MTSRTSVRPSACTHCRGGGGGAGEHLGNFPWREIAWQRCIWQPAFFWPEIILVTSNGIKSSKEHERRGKKLIEKFKRTKPREKPRKTKITVKLTEIERETKHLFTTAFR